MIVVIEKATSSNNGKSDSASAVATQPTNCTNSVAGLSMSGVVSKKARLRNGPIDRVLRAGFAPSAERLLSEIVAEGGGIRRLAAMIVECMMEPVANGKDQRRKRRVGVHLMKGLGSR